MESSFVQVFKFDKDGFFDREVTAQVVGGVPLLPASTSTLVPWGDGIKDETKFYRFDGAKWIAEPKPVRAEDLIGVVISHESRTPHDEEMRELIKKFAQTAGFREKRGADLSWSIERIPEKTEAEKRAEAEQQARSKRDQLLAESDYYLQPDYPSSEEGLSAVKAYRTALRDVPQQKDFPLIIEWPVKPDVLN